MNNCVQCQRWFSDTHRWLVLQSRMLTQGGTADRQGRPIGAHLGELDLAGLREGPHEGGVAHEEHGDSRGHALHQLSPKAARICAWSRTELGQVLHPAPGITLTGMSRRQGAFLDTPPSDD